MIPYPLMYRQSPEETVDPTLEIIDGKLMWRWPDGKVLPCVRGGATDDDGDDDDDDDKGKPEPKSKTFSQDEMNRISSREKKDGRRTREAEILEELGVSSLDEAKEVLAAKRKTDEDKLSDVDKAAREAERARQEAEADRAAAKKERVNAQIERALLKAGLTEPKDKDKDGKGDLNLQRALRFLDLPDDADADTITAAVAELKADVPSLFAAQPENDGEKTGTPPAAPPPGTTTPPTDSMAKAKAQLDRMTADGTLPPQRKPAASTTS